MRIVEDIIYPYDTPDIDEPDADLILGHQSLRVKSAKGFQKSKSNRVTQSVDCRSDTVVVPERSVRIFRDVVFWPGCSVVQLGRGSIDKYSEADVNRLRVLIRRRHLRKYPVRKMKGYVTSIDCGPSWRNYYHFFCESLPRIWALHSDICVGIDSITLVTTRPYREEEYRIIKSLLPPNVELLYVPSNIRIRADRYVHLPILTLPGVCLLPNEYYEFFKERVSRSLGILLPTNGTRKIYVSRSDASRRRFVNEQDVEAFLCGEGFEKVCLAGRSIRDQALIFGNASKVIAQHGAALTNLIYAPQSVRVMEIHASSTDPRSSDYYRSLAFSRNLEYNDMFMNMDDKNKDIHMCIDDLVETGWFQK